MVGALVLLVGLTIALMTASQRIASREAIDVRSRASEQYGQFAGGSINNNSCFKIDGSSSSASSETQFCKGLQFTCKTGLKSSLTAEELRDAISSALGKSCTISGNDTISCEDSTKACPGYDNTVRDLMAAYCNC